MSSQIDLSGPVFVIPADALELTACATLFLVVIALIYASERVALRYHTHRVHTIRERVLFWELGVIVTGLILYALGERCALIPLTFLLALLIMWYLSRAIHRHYRGDN